MSVSSNQFLALNVLMPRMLYKRHILVMPVSKIMIPIITRITLRTVPIEKKKGINIRIIPIIIRIILSRFPTVFSMLTSFLFEST